MSEDDEIFLDSAPEPNPNVPYHSLTPDCILDAVDSQGYVSNAQLLALNSYENRVYQVGMEQGQPLVAKFYRPQRWSDAQIIEDHQFTQLLEDLEIPAVPPLKNSNHETLFFHQEFRFALYPRRGGHAPELDNLDNLLVLGRYLGRIHAAGAKKSFKHREKISVQRLAIDSYEFLRKQNFVPIELQNAYNSICDDLIAKLQHRWKEVPCEFIRLHGDCHRGNILWRDDRAHFVDFDDACNGPAVQDLWMLLAGDRETQTVQINQLLEGYNQFCHFPLSQLALIESLRTMRIMHYAAWLARRWHDPTFPLNFPWFNTPRYWSEHILELREQQAALDEPPLQVLGAR